MSALLEIEEARIYYPIRAGVFNRTVEHVKAVDGVSLTLDSGDALGLVGESGCGKSTLVNGIIQLEPLYSGKILFDHHDIKQMKKVELKRMHREMQIVFQDPFWSLNPRWLVRDIVGEPLRIHEHVGVRDLPKRVAEVLAMVNIGEDAMFKYPHEFSGGYRQRLAIARALALRPKLVVLDEPTSAIDVVSQHQILSMLTALKEQLGLTFILVSHDLSVVRYLATKLGVMYLGKLVEWGSADEVFVNRVHPYTIAMFNSVPDPTEMGVEHLVTLAGEVPSAISPPSGCRFHTRCERAMDICREKEPDARQVSDDHWTACWLMPDARSDARRA